MQPGYTSKKPQFNIITDKSRLQNENESEANDLFIKNQNFSAADNVMLSRQIK